MGFYSQVQITAESEAFKMFDDVLKKHELHYDVLGADNAKVIYFDWVKWYPDFQEVQDVEKIQKLLETAEYDKDGYGYKMVILNEDDTHEEYYNETGDAHFCDLGVQCYIENPYAV